MWFLRLLLYGFVGWALFALAMSGFHTIPHGEVGVVLVNVGDKPELDEVLDPGWYWRRPFVVEVQTFPTTVQTLENQHAVWDRNRRPYTIDTRVGYQFDRKAVVALFQKVGPAYQAREEVVHRLEEVVSDVAKGVDRDEAFDQREKLAAQVKERLAGLVPQGIGVLQLALKGVEFPEDYRKAVDALPVRATSQTEELDVLSSEKRSLHLTLVVVYRVNPAQLVEVASSLGAQFKETLLQPVIQARASALAAGKPADELWSPEGRQQYAADVKKALEAELNPRGFQIEKVSVTRFEFDPELMAEVKARELSAVELAGMDLKQRMAEKAVAVERVKTDEERRARLASAETEAKARTIEAQSAKESAVLKAEGDREALSRVVELIEKNPRLLEYLSVSRLSDKVQVIVAPPGGMGAPLVGREVMKEGK